MAQSAVRTNSWDGKWEPFSSKLDEWLFFKDELDNKKVNDPLLKLTRHEIAEQVLHDIEDLGQNTTNDWLDYFPLFEEIQTSADNFEGEVGNEEKPGNCALKFEAEQFSSKDGLVAPENHQQPLADKDLFSVSNENAATFILSNDNVVFINNEPFLTLVPSQPEPTLADVKNNRTEIPPEECENKNSENVNIQPEFSCLYLDTPDVKMEMAVVDEIIRNTALELDQWESDTSRSETSWDGTSASDMSPKGKEDETDDPDWKPDALESGGRKCSKRSKPYHRGGSQEEKKLRKKEQNKNAATRYRQKKKAEVNEILKEEELLKEKKASLEEKVADIQSEIKYLKKLMRDLFKAKGLIN